MLNLITNPLAPIPSSMSKREAKRIAELRGAYQASLATAGRGVAIKTPEDAHREFGALCVGRTAEALWVVPTNCRTFALSGAIELTRGDSNGCDVPLALVLRAVLACEWATGAILMHNHPSGDVTPSASDRAVTQRVAAGMRACDLVLSDHIILAPTEFKSLRRDDPGLFR